MKRKKPPPTIYTYESEEIVYHACRENDRRSAFWASGWQTWERVGNDAYLTDVWMLQESDAIQWLAGEP